MDSRTEVRSEAHLLGEVRRIVQEHRGFVYHTRDSRGSDRGWPDVVIGCFGARRVIIRELKRDGEPLSVDQQRWLRILRDAGIDAGVWRPRDLRSGTIEAQISSLDENLEEAA